MKKIVLKVVKQCVSSDGVSVGYVREEIITEYLSNFWVRRNALDKKNYKQLIETTVEIAGKVGGAEIIKKVSFINLFVNIILIQLVDELKDENEAYRKIVMETMENIVSNYGVADINSKLEEKLMDGILFAFQE